MEVICEPVFDNFPCRIAIFLRFFWATGPTLTALVCIVDVIDLLQVSEFDVLLAQDALEVVTLMLLGKLFEVYGVSEEFGLDREDSMGQNVADHFVLEADAVLFLMDFVRVTTSY